MQTSRSGKGSLILGPPPPPQLLLWGLKAAHPLAADSFPSLTNAQGSFPNRKARAGNGTPTPLQAQACCVHPLTRREQGDVSGKAGAGAQAHTSPFSMRAPSPRSPLSENSNAKRRSQRPPELGRLREGGHVCAQQGAGARRSPRLPPLTAGGAETPPGPPTPALTPAGPRAPGDRVCVDLLPCDKDKHRPRLGVLPAPVSVTQQSLLPFTQQRRECPLQFIVNRSGALLPARPLPVLPPRRAAVGWGPQSSEDPWGWGAGPAESLLFQRSGNALCYWQRALAASS